MKPVMGLKNGEAWSCSRCSKEYYSYGRVDDCCSPTTDKEKQQMAQALKKAKAELTALWSFYGQGLEVANWHLNGALEPLDNFFEDNSQGALEAINALKTID